VLLAGATIGGVLAQAHAANSKTRFVARNFFGVLRIYDKDGDDEVPDRHRVLLNGNINHGFQILNDTQKAWPVSYYALSSGIGEAIRNHPKRKMDAGMNIGVIGLGTGTLCSYGLPGDNVRFYDINPTVQKIAQEQFTYLSDSPAFKTVVMGDARISMERELKAGQKQDFDILAIDAFSSDSIPLHLLTKECMDIFVQHMAPGGVIVFHISNRHLNLEPVVRALADKFKMKACRVDNKPDPSQCVLGSSWVLISSDEELLDAAFQINGQKPSDDAPANILLTDDTTNLWKVIDWSR
jgi:hypothetical protein